MPSSAPAAAKEGEGAEGRNAARGGCSGSGRAGERAGEERGGGRRSPGAPENRGPAVQSAQRAGGPAAWGSVPLGPSPSGGRGGPALRREVAAWRRGGPRAGPASRACRDGCGEDTAGGWRGGPRAGRRAGVAAVAFLAVPGAPCSRASRRGEARGAGRPRPSAELGICRGRGGRAQETPGPGGSDPRGRVAPAFGSRERRAGKPSASSPRAAPAPRGIRAR